MKGDSGVAGNGGKGKEISLYVSLLPIVLLITSYKASAGNKFASKWISSYSKFIINEIRIHSKLLAELSAKEAVTGIRHADSTILWHNNVLICMY